MEIEQHKKATQASLQGCQRLNSNAADFIPGQPASLPVSAGRGAPSTGQGMHAGAAAYSSTGDIVGVYPSRAVAVAGFLFYV